MIPVNLTRIKTRDGVSLEGIIVEPKRKSKTALVWIHGLGSRFYTSQMLIKQLSAQCQKNGIGYFKFNTRGHDQITLYDKKLIGAAFEKFEECMLDIRAMIQFAASLGYQHIILVGTSTGSNKVLYYTYKTGDPRIKALILAGSVSDASVGKKEYGAIKLARGISIARRMVAKKSPALMSSEFGFYSPQRFLSLFSADSSENVFPYHNPKAQWKELKSIKIPVGVIFGSRDQYLGRPAKEVIKILEKNAVSTKSFTSAIIQGADHSFTKKPKELADTIIRFIKRAVV